VPENPARFDFHRRTTIRRITRRENMTRDSDPAGKTSATGQSSPRILEVSWGKLAIEGRSSPFKDAKLYPGGASEWDWRETGTSHGRGIQPAAVEELLARGATVIVLATGYNGRLGVARKTTKMLEAAGVSCHIAETGEAVNLYNKLAAREPAGGLFHTTC